MAGAVLGKTNAMQRLTVIQETADWKWQQRNAIRSVDRLLEVFPDLAESTVAALRGHLDGRKLQITPHYLGLIARENGDRAPRADDPIWRQVAPIWSMADSSATDYDGATENWEMPEEMKTPIAQHKYDNRIIVRLSNVCHSYCQFCYEALRTIEKHSSKEAFNDEHWQATLAYVRTTPQIEEVVLSGGEPLMLDDPALRGVLRDLRAIERNLVIRIHTRALTFNPYRITPDLVAMLSEFDVTAVGLHVAHPREISPAFEDAARALRSASVLLFANIPLLAGINDDVATMRELWMRLYGLRITPHYLYHFMPFSPGSAAYRTPVDRGIELIAALKRRISNLAVPEFVLPHPTGKFSMPIASEPTGVERVQTGDGRRFVEYTNWRGQRVRYPDSW
jgi:lysine 2,3-aminomutase